MGRAIVYGIILVLGIFLLSTVFVFRRGGDPSEAVMSVSVHDLSVAPQVHAEERVTTSGVLRLFQEPAEHFLVTADGLGIIVRGYDERALLELVGRAVTVTGRFGFDEADGTYIEADSVTVAE